MPNGSRPERQGMVKSVGLTDIGRKRATNQDAYEFTCFEDGAGAAVICDGMGGANGGDVASRLAVKSIMERMGHYHSALDDEGIRGLLYSAAQEANRSIYTTACNDEKLSGMGTTMVLALLRDRRLHIVHAGDSRAYLVSGDGSLVQLTRDHSLVQNMIESGELTPDEAASHPQKNVITRVLGVFGEVEIDYAETMIAEGDKVLLCTDGLCGFVSDEEISNIFKSHADAPMEELPALLIAAANEAGGGDNITAVILWDAPDPVTNQNSAED